MCSNAKQLHHYCSRFLVLSLPLLSAGLLLLLFSLSLQVKASPDSNYDCSQVTDIAANECEALKVFYDSTDGPNWSVNSNWLSSPHVCREDDGTGWYGVYCTNNHVERIALINNGLNGTLPDALCKLDLTELHLQTNDKLHGDVPSCLGKLTRMTELTLFSTKLTNCLNPAFANLVNLTILSISGCQVNGPFPAWISEKFSKLTILALDTTGLTGSIPADMGNLVNLKVLQLNNNKLNGQVPSSIAQLTELTTLTLSHNMLLLPDSQIVQSFLQQKSPNWETSQTVTPSDLDISVTGTTTATLTWTPIQFHNAAGYYKIAYTITPTWAVSTTMTTPDKQAASFTLSNLCPNTTYYVKISTYSVNNVASGYPATTLESELSAALIMTTKQRTIDELNAIALAFDSNLNDQYETTTDDIRKTTGQNTSKVALTLGDRNGTDDTEIVTDSCGSSKIIAGLPELISVHSNALVHVSDISEVDSKLVKARLNPNLHELDMTDPSTIAAFILWARTNCGEIFDAVCDNPKITFSYVGHGTAIAPAIDISHYLTDSQQLANAAGIETFLPPAPTKVEATPDELTDSTPLALISPFSLTQALRLATADGENPISVLDIVHCFGGTIEELYELSSGEKPYAKYIVASPTYAYASGMILSAAMLAIDPAQQEAEMAINTVQAYEATLAEADGYDGFPNTVDHPRVIAAIDSSKIPAIKAQIDLLAELLLDNFSASTIDALLASHEAATVTHYDTTTCTVTDEDSGAQHPQDYALTAEDGLSDLSNFAEALATNFQNTPTVASAAQAIVPLVDAAILTTTHVSGTPWFATNFKPNWDFARATGIAIYTDFQGVTLGNKQFIGWQAHWYTPDPSNDNAHPMQFVQGDHTWANVLLRYWEEEYGKNNQLVTYGCMPKLPGLQPHRLFLPVIQQ